MNVASCLGGALALNTPAEKNCTDSVYKLFILYS